MNKKALMTFNIINFIPKIIFLAVIAIVVVMLVRTLVVTEVNVQDAEAGVLINRILYSPNGLVYTDNQINRVYPGIIDIENFNETILEKAISPVPYMGAKLDLVMAEQTKTIKYNEKVYDKLYVYKDVREGGSKEIIQNIHVLVKVRDIFVPGVLKMSVVVR